MFYDLFIEDQAGDEVVKMATLMRRRRLMMILFVRVTTSSRCLARGVWAEAERRWRHLESSALAASHDQWLREHSGNYRYLERANSCIQCVIVFLSFCDNGTLTSDNDHRRTSEPGGNSERYVIKTLFLKQILDVLTRPVDYKWDAKLSIQCQYESIRDPCRR